MFGMTSRLSTDLCLAWPAVLLALHALIFSVGSASFAAEPAQNVILITLDGLRCEEVFNGADERLMIPDLGVKDTEKLKEQFSGKTSEIRRSKLLPHLWSRIENDAWIAGDYQLGSVVQVTNGKYFSYPGYNEILTGHADEKVDSNAKKYNENVTVLEWLNQRPKLNGSVAAFCSWDVFPYIINDRRSGIPVNAGWSKLTIGNSQTLNVLNDTAANLFHEWDGVRYDVFTASGALEAMRTAYPRVLYVSLGETDDWAHAGRYDRYLLSAFQNDGFIHQIVAETERHEQYRGKTAFLITSDHGRGDGREGWKSHSSSLPGSERIWMAAFGAGIDRQGIDRNATYQQGQIAATVAALLGFDYREFNPQAAPPLPILANTPPAQ